MKALLIDLITALLIFVGLGSADSPNMIVPFVMVLAGLYLLKHREERTDGRKTDR